MTTEESAQEAPSTKATEVAQGQGVQREVLEATDFYQHQDISSIVEPGHDRDLERDTSIGELVFYNL